MKVNSSEVCIDECLSSPEYEFSSSLIYLSPTISPLGFWEILWAVGITNFIIKFLFMGIKCLILLLPSSLVSYRTQVWLISWECWSWKERCAAAYQHLTSVGICRGVGWCWLKSWVKCTRTQRQFHCGSATWWPTRRRTVLLGSRWGSCWLCSTSFWRWDPTDKQATDLEWET